MTSIVEPIGAGIIVALINKFIINNHGLCSLCSGCRDVKKDIDNDTISSSSTTTIDTIEIHAHI